MALPGTTLWIDAGFSDVADCAFWLPLGATLVIGSESLAGVDDWREIHAAFGESVVLSLDFDAGGRRGPDALFDDPSLWPQRVIAMNLAGSAPIRVPTRTGSRALIGMADGRAIFAAGGIRDARDLAAIADLQARWRAARHGAASQRRHAK